MRRGLALVCFLPLACSTLYSANDEAPAPAPAGVDGGTDAGQQASLEEAGPADAGGPSGLDCTGWAFCDAFERSAADVKGQWTSLTVGAHIVSNGLIAEPSRGGNVLWVVSDTVTAPAPGDGYALAVAYAPADLKRLELDVSLRVDVSLTSFGKGASASVVSVQCDDGSFAPTSVLDVQVDARGVVLMLEKGDLGRVIGSPSVWHHVGITTEPTQTTLVLDGVSQIVQRPISLQSRATCTLTLGVKPLAGPLSSVEARFDDVRLK
jgi:hypothetical protein